jgi:hypothetical protein
MDNAVEAATPTLTPGTQEYDDAMVAKYDASTGVEVAEVAEKPDHVPEKFWDKEKGELRTEALLKSYSELEKGRSKAVTSAASSTATAEESIAEAEKAAPPADMLSEAKEVVETAGLNFDSMSDEFRANGELSAATYDALAAKGIPNAMVNSYIAGQRAVATQWDNAGYEVAGGKEQFDKMATWAATAMSAQEARELNAAFSGTDTNVDRMRLAVGGLRAKYEAANGRTPALLSGVPSSTNGQGYESKAQMTEDMKNPKYAKDPAFRAMVTRKLSTTTVF